MSYPFLSLKIVTKSIPVAKRKRVSLVARSRDGFVAAYQLVGDWRGLGNRWLKKRDAFIARHMAQMIANDEPFYDDVGEPTRRHLALIMWAYSPDPVGVACWTKERS